jgi:outer membrane receptor for ferrienterochelin and colicin
MKLKPLYIYFLIFFSAGFIISQSVLFAGTTGKITGFVKDASTLEPLTGANVILNGTYLGAATDVDGQYTILNVPPGLFSLQVTMIGYKKSIVQEINVKIDLTTTIDVNLETIVLDINEVVTIVAERPLVQPDMTSSMASIDAAEIDQLPVQSVGDILEIQAGVVRDGSNFHIRGGRANEVAFWVDGIEVTDVYSGERMGTTVEKNAIQELQVVSGTFNAEYGKAMAGIVNIITKEGGKKYSGKLSTYAGDYVSNSDLYSVPVRIDTTIDSETGEIVEIDRTENPLSDLNLTFNTDLTLSGPVPFLGDNISFFANGRYVTREGYLYGREWFLPQGLPGDSSLVPMRSGYDYSGLGKVTWRLSPNLKMNYQLLYSKSYDDRSTSDARNYRYIPGGVRQLNSYSINHIFSLTHTLSENTFYELRLARLFRERTSFLYEDPTKRPHWLVRATIGSEETIIDPSTTEGNAVLDSVKQAEIDYEWFIDPNDPAGYLDPDSASSPAQFSFYRSGTQNDYDFRTYGFWTAKFDFISQISSSHQLKTGFELKSHELNVDNYTLIAKKKEGKEEEIVPFWPEVPSVSSLSRDKYNRKPWELSTYFQDKIELKEMIINIGLRFDYFNANAVKPADPTDPDIYNPIRNENIYKDWIEPGQDLSQVEYEAYLRGFTKYTPEERRAFMHTKVDPKMQLSPRLGIAYPITERGIIHFSYGHFLAMPGFRYLYDNADFKLKSGGSRLIGNADLEPERTIHYELGLQQQLGNDIGLDITMFYKDTRRWIGASALKRTASTVVFYSQYENKDYSNVMGITVDFEKRFSRSISANIYYSYQVAEGTYSNPDDEYNAVYSKATAQDEPIIALVPMDWDQRHTLNAYFTWRYKGWTATLTGKYESGQPYTPSIVKSEIVGGSSYIGWKENSERLPATSSIDVRILKTIPIKNMNLNLFLVVYNLFDQKGERSIYRDTGTAEYSANLFTDYSGYQPNRIGSYNDYTKRPDWYQAPREIQLGIELEF